MDKKQIEDIKEHYPKGCESCGCTRIRQVTSTVEILDVADGEVELGYEMESIERFCDECGEFKEEINRPDAIKRQVQYMRERHAKVN